MNKHINQTFILHNHGNPLIQITEEDVEKLVAFLDINKMRENPMVRDFHAQEADRFFKLTINNTFGKNGHQW